MTQTINLALIQQVMHADTENNLQHIYEQLETAAAQGAQLVLLPELHNHYYPCQQEHPQYFDLAEPIPGPTTNKMARWAQQLKLVIVASLFEKRAPGIYHNTAVVFDNDGRLAGRYRKMHIPDDPGYYEKFYFTPGDNAFTPIETSLGQLGVLVCWDQWFPEAARLMALAGAELLLYPTAIGWDASDSPAEQKRQQEAWLTVQRGHAIANHLPLAACNRGGFEPAPAPPQVGVHFWGSSFICGVQGELLAQSQTPKNEIVQATIDKRQTETTRRMWPFLRDRRIDYYQGLLKRYHDPETS
jgi:N-carbamoylputrescine amidase